jgi:hypothetical protein
MDEEYLNLFKKTQNDENLNETTQNQNQYENLQKREEQWQNLNEVQQDARRYQTNENLNDGWGNLDIQIETRRNGVPQQRQEQQLQPNSRRHRNAGQNLNGLDQFLDEEDLREVVKQPKPVEKQPVILEPPRVENIKDADVVSVEMFENMNSNALLTLANGKISQIDPNKVTNNQSDRQVRYIKS